MYGVTANINAFALGQNLLIHGQRFILNGPSVKNSNPAEAFKREGNPLCIGSGYDYHDQYGTPVWIVQHR